MVNHNRTDFINAQLASQQPTNATLPNIFITEDLFHSCDKIAFRWVVKNGFDGKGKYDIRGIDTLDVVKVKDHWKIKADYSEWNNVGFLAGIGVCAVC